MGEADHVVKLANAKLADLICKLDSNPAGSGRIREQNRAERDTRSSCRNELERVSTGSDAAHTDDRQAGRRIAGIDGCKRDRLQRRSGETTGAAGETRPQRTPVEGQAEDRVDYRVPFG